VAVLFLVPVVMAMNGTFEPLIHGGQHKVEMIVRDNQVDSVVKEITEHACTR
jgi:nitrogen regulatory protein PII